MDRARIINTAARQTGFSLVEILVAIAILALAASVIVMNAPPSRSAATQDATLFAVRLQKIVNRAAITGTPMQIQFNKGGYEVSEFTNSGWRVLPNNSALNLNGVGVRLEIDQPQSLSENSRAMTGQKKNDEADRLILIDPIGAAPSFTAWFGANPSVGVSMNEAGKIGVVAE